MKLETASSVALCVVSFALSACGSPEQGSAPEESTSHDPSRPELDLPASVSRSDFSVLGGTEKIRNGSPFGYFGLSGNSIVMIQGTTPYSCTAQIINKYFLLTAAHCIGDVMPTGSSWLQLTFTNTAGNSFPLPVVAGFGGQISGWRQGDNDIGLIFLAGGIDTCQDTLANCRNSRPNVPVNAIFQVYFPGFEYTASKYSFVGYGSTDDVSPDLQLRVGQSRITSSSLTDNHNAHLISTTWAGTTETRPCKGDSGSPLLNFQFSRLLHTGVLSSAAPCTFTSGGASYSGLSNPQAQWLLSVMSTATPAPNPAYHCTAGTTSMPGGGMLLAFGCDNDGTVYP